MTCPHAHIQLRDVGLAVRKLASERCAHHELLQIGVVLIKGERTVLKQLQQFSANRSHIQDAPTVTLRWKFDLDSLAMLCMEKLELGLVSQCTRD